MVKGIVEKAVNTVTGVTGTTIETVINTAEKVEKTVLRAPKDFDVETGTSKKVKEFAEETVGREIKDFNEARMIAKETYEKPRDTAQEIIERARERFNKPREREFEKIEDKGSINKNSPRPDNQRSAVGALFESIFQPRSNQFFSMITNGLKRIIK